MTDSPLVNDSFPHLKGFGAFLLEYCLEEATAANLAYAEKIKLPLLSLLSHMSREELHAIAKQSLKQFLEQLAAGDAMDYTKENLRRWRADTLPHIPRHGVEVSDIVLTYHTRKHTLIGLLSRYTTDVATIIDLVQELEVFFAEVERFAFGLFVDLKNEEHEAFNLQLQEDQAKLEEAYEELRASGEDLQEANEALEEEVSRRTGIEKALEKETNFLKAILENISDGIVACDDQGVLSFFNTATRNFHGLPEKPLPADQWSSYYHLYRADGVTPLTRDEVPLFRAYQGERLEETEIVIATADSDSKKVLLAKGQPIVSAEGKKEGAVVVMHDITDLKQAQQVQKEALQQLHAKNQALEEALEKLRATEEQLLGVNNELETRIQARTQELQTSEQQIRLITDALPVLITYVDADERYRFTNKTYEEWFNRSRSDVYGKKLVEVMGAETYARVKGTVKRVLQGEKITLETKLNYRQFDLRDVSINYIPHRVEEQVVGYFALITDISAHNKAKEALQQANQEVAALLVREKEAYAQAETSRRQLYNLFMQAPALLCIVRGREFVFELANAPYLEVIGARESVIGKPFKEVIPDVDAGILQLLTNVLDTGESFVGREVPMTADWERNGSPETKYFNFIYDPLFDPDGTVGGIIGFGYDVTDHVQARQELEDTAMLMKSVNEQLSQKNAELNKINNDLDNFVYTASHDLRSPVVNMEGLVMALKQLLKKPGIPKPDAVIGMMEASIAKLNKTIRDLTEITKAQKGLEEPEEKVSIKDILEDIKLDLQKSIAEANPLFSEELQVETITYPPRNLRSILYNLLTNALKYRSEQPLEISIKTYREGAYVVLCIQDNGLGLSEQQLPKLFTMFKRMHTHVEGTGIGLYIIKRIVENSGGKIEVESKLNEGTRFKVYLATGDLR